MVNWEEKVKNYLNNEKAYQQMKEYVFLILENNKKFNLTGFDEKSIWLEGIYQSIFLLNKFIACWDQNDHLLDIGSGAGFPSIPFLIQHENKINLTIYEPIGKRVLFLNQVKEKLNLTNLSIIQKRIEDEEGEQLKFNFIVARAVMPLNMLIEVSAKVGAIGCQYIFLKSKDAEEEKTKSLSIIKQLKIDELELINVDLGDQKIHNIIKYTKTKETPIGYPRKWQIIKKNK